VAVLAGIQLMNHAHFCGTGRQKEKKEKPYRRIVMKEKLFYHDNTVFNLNDFT
jgi:hypothetical protein